MNTRTFNIIGCIVFGILAILLFIAGFYNKTQFIFSAISACLCIFALFDSSDGDSIIAEINKKMNKGHSVSE